MWPLLIAQLGTFTVLAGSMILLRDMLVQDWPRIKAALLWSPDDDD